MTAKVFKIEAPNFVAGGEYRRACHAGLCGVICVHTAPIIGYMKGWNEDQIRHFCEKKNWKYDSGVTEL